VGSRERLPGRGSATGAARVKKRRGAALRSCRLRYERGSCPFLVQGPAVRFVAARLTHYSGGLLRAHVASGPGDVAEEDGGGADRSTPRQLRNYCHMRAPTFVVFFSRFVELCAMEALGSLARARGRRACWNQLADCGRWRLGENGSRADVDYSPHIHHWRHDHWLPNRIPLQRTACAHTWHASPGRRLDLTPRSCSNTRCGFDRPSARSHWWHFPGWCGYFMLAARDIGKRACMRCR